MVSRTMLLAMLRSFVSWRWACHTGPASSFFELCKSTFGGLARSVVAAAGAVVVQLVTRNSSSDLKIEEQGNLVVGSPSGVTRPSR